MTNKQIRWIQDGEGDERIYRGMIVGWQTVLLTLKATVGSFNFQNSQAEKDEMKEIAVKRLVIGLLVEIRDRLDVWIQTLRDMEAFSGKSQEKRGELRPLFRQIRGYDFIRNNAFHCGDPTEDVDALLNLYQRIDETDLPTLQRAMEQLVDLGECLKMDAHLKEESLRRRR